MKKRMFLAVMACLIAVSCLSGCRSSAQKTNADEQVELHWVFGGPGKLEDSDGYGALSMNS